MDKKEVQMLIPFDPDEFWDRMRKILNEEIGQLKGRNLHLMQTPGLTEKPLYKIAEICELFKITRPTLDDWVRHGKLRKLKVRSRVYFLGKDIERILKGETGEESE